MFGESFSTLFYGNTVFDWSISLLIILLTVVVAKIIYWMIKKYVKRFLVTTKSRLDDLIVDMLEEPLVFAVIIAGIWFALDRLTFSADIEILISRAYYILIIFNIAWLISRLVDSLISEYLVPIVEKSQGDLDDQLLPLVRKGLRITIWIVAVIIALNNAGYDVGAIIAGLGIGGLAFALAAQDTVSNLFGGFTVIVDKPFTITDRIKIAGFDGTVKEIGIRSTRLVTLEGRVVTIPNSYFSKNPIENVSSEPSRKIVLNLGLTYDMNDKKIEQAIGLLKEIVQNNPHVRENSLISFNGFGDFALNILFIYYIKKRSNILETQTEINLEILRKFTANNLDFAFPSQTIYTKQS